MADYVHFAVPKTTRIYQDGALVEPRTILWLLHGYGQLAADFMAQCRPALWDQILFLCPEALSRFYLDRAYTRVGASWMTREDRITDIEDNLHYLDLLFEQFDHRFPDAIHAILGFSQGAATAWRYVCHRPERFTKAILWAGTVPEQMDRQIPGNGMTVQLVRGNEDQIFTLNAFEKQHAYFLDRIPEQVFIAEFQGGHEINPELLRQLI